MAKRASTHESLSLAFELMKRIPRSNKITASALKTELEHAGFKRDIRTIQRNLEMLCEHFDIECDNRSKPYGYSWNRHGQGLNVSNLSPHEAVLLSLADNYLHSLLPSNILSSMRSMFDEAKRTLAVHGNHEQEKEWLHKVKIVSDTQPLLPPPLKEEILKDVSKALYFNRILKVEYLNAQQRQNTVDVMPLGLAQQGCRLYLVCRFDGYDNERNLALHRIKRTEVSTFNFERPKNFKLSQYEADGRFGFGDGKKCGLSFNIKKDAGHHLKETKLSEDQTVIDKSEFYHITATVIDSIQLDKWLRGFGKEIWNIQKSATANF